MKRILIYVPVTRPTVRSVSPRYVRGIAGTPPHTLPGTMPCDPTAQSSATSLLQRADAKPHVADLLIGQGGGHLLDQFRSCETSVPATRPSCRRSLPPRHDECSPHDCAEPSARRPPSFQASSRSPADLQLGIPAPCHQRAERLGNPLRTLLVVLSPSHLVVQLAGFPRLDLSRHRRFRSSLTRSTITCQRHDDVAISVIGRQQVPPNRRSRFRT